MGYRLSRSLFGDRRLSDGYEADGSSEALGVGFGAFAVCFCVDNNDISKMTNSQ